MNLSPKEMLSDCENKLGEEFGRAYYHAYNEWCNLWIVWKQFRNLFCSGPERVELLNRCGAGLFYQVDKIFLESIMLSLCRLTDPPETCGRHNLTIKRFSQFMDSEERTEKMKNLISEAEISTAFARDWRNRRIGHNDYYLKLGKAKPLKSATIDGIEAAVRAVFDVFSYISHDFLKQSTEYEVIDQLNNEMVTLNRLYIGDTAFREEVEKIEKGQFTRRERPAWLSKSA